MPCQNLHALALGCQPLVRAQKGALQAKMRDWWAKGSLQARRITAAEKQCPWRAVVELKSGEGCPQDLPSGAGYVLLWMSKHLPSLLLAADVTTGSHHSGHIQITNSTLAIRENHVIEAAFV